MTKLLVVLGLALLVGVASASIEREPVRVTNRNSGPKYDIDDAERARAPTDDEQDPRAPLARPTESAEGPGAADNDSPIGHLFIRRIYLTPVAPGEGAANNGMWLGRPSGLPIWGGARGQADQAGEESADRPPTRPLWPLLLPSMPVAPSAGGRGHLLGADEASRSPMWSGERDDGSSDQRKTSPIDPIQLLLDLMRQTLSSANLPADLSPKESESNNNNTNNANNSNNGEPIKPEASTELERPNKPTSSNETREDVVEIEGKKFLRKTVINRHIGNNIVFMTKRLIFTPLNETDQSTTPVPSSTEPAGTTTTTSTTSAAASETSTVAEPEPSPSPAPTDSTSDSTNKAPAEAPEGSTSAPEETTKRESLAERVSEAVERAAERLVERVGNEFASSNNTSKPDA